MTDLPPQAITAALNVLAARGKPRGRSITFGDAGLRAAVTAALDAAAPHLAAAEREACARLAEAWAIQCREVGSEDAAEALTDFVADLLRKDHP